MMIELNTLKEFGKEIIVVASIDGARGIDFQFKLNCLAALVIINFKCE